jgi:hypothetical protein
MEESNRSRVLFAKDARHIKNETRLWGYSGGWMQNNRGHPLLLSRGEHGGGGAGGWRRRRPGGRELG